MSRTIQVLVVIAIVCSAVEICALIVIYFEPPRNNSEPYFANMAERAALRWKVYWFSGAPIAIVGIFLKKNFELLGYALFIVGIYLMLFGNNGGFWSEGYIAPRLITSFLTFIGLLFLIKNENWSKNT